MELSITFVLSLKQGFMKGGISQESDRVYSNLHEIFI